MSRRIHKTVATGDAERTRNNPPGHTDPDGTTNLTTRGGDGGYAGVFTAPQEQAAATVTEKRPATSIAVDLADRDNLTIDDAIEARSSTEADNNAVRDRRRAHLLTHGSRLDPARIERLRPVLIDQILTVTSGVQETDRHRWIVLSHYADWFEQTTGLLFDPKRHLADEYIEDYHASRTHLTFGSARNHRATLTTIRDGRKLRPAFSEAERRPPYNRAQRDRFFAAAVALTDGYWRQIAMTALYLVFYAGLHDREVVGLRGTDITATGLGVDLTVHGRTRDRIIPVFGPAANHLRQFIGDPGYVFWPKFTKRRSNSLPHLRYNLGPIDDLFTTFDHRGARKQYLIELMARPIPMNVVLYVADAAMNDHQPQGLYAWVERPTPTEVRDALHHALTTAPL